MPYKRRFRRFRKRRKRKNIKKVIQSVISKNLETKYISRFFTGGTNNYGTSTNGPQDLQLNLISQGTDIFERIGDQVHLIGLNGKLWFSHNGSGPSTFRCRMFIYIPKSVGDTMTVQGVEYTSQPNVNEFTILYDRCFTLVYDVPGLAPTDKTITCHDVSLKFNRGERRGILSTFEGAGASTIKRNNLRLYIVSDATGAAPSKPVVQGYLTLWYKDG